MKHKNIVPGKIPTKKDKKGNVIWFDGFTKYHNSGKKLFLSTTLNKWEHAKEKNIFEPEGKPQVIKVEKHTDPSQNKWNNEFKETRGESGFRLFKTQKDAQNFAKK